ncbi:hypothetical protein K503DRAFT_134873 [Rhizopogon vinicolor AM-OR11-026]|uniref:Uncharacterized protein n=1 Tax=Rhizopogon vinicolor AM-OR11-026 TaxID=1314800 RepID=A0A1B7N1Q0_9AGAM|nr:hypothetical protein K503DRAFT_134873 [Rhizopogon vinicolor AM-OR11-026]
MRRPVRQLRDTLRLRPGFFDESPDPHFSGIHRLRNSSACQENAAKVNGRTLFGHFSSLFRHTYYNSSHTPAQHHPLDRPRNTAQVHGRNGEGIQLQERRLTTFDVPFAQGYRRNASVREVRMKKEKERNAKKASASSPRPPRSSVTQRSGGAVQIQPSSQPHAAVPTSSTTPAVTTSMSALPDVTIRQAGRWTRFWLRFCCTSIEYTGDGHH